MRAISSAAFKSVGSAMPTSNMPLRSSSTIAWKLPRLTFRQQPDQFGFDLKVLEIDIGEAELFGEGLGNILFGNKGIVHQDAPQLEPAALLLLKRERELLFR